MHALYLLSGMISQEHLDIFSIYHMTTQYHAYRIIRIISVISCFHAESI